MNERIRQLALQAGMYIVDDKFSTYGKFAEKFAELLVWECANRATWAQDSGEADVGGEVLKHFGVEE